MVLLPCGLLIVFGYRMIRQDRELAARHAEDERRAWTLQQQQARLVRLESLKRKAVEDFFAERRPSIEFAALVVEGGFRAPWEPGAAVRSTWDGCEREEFTAGRLVDAIGCYRRALAAAATQAQKSHVRLLLGRALEKAGRSVEAAAENRELLRTPFPVVDDQGVPYAYYAADRLSRKGGAMGFITERFAADEHVVSPAAAYLLKTVAQRLGDSVLEGRAAAAAALAAHVESLRADLPGLLPYLRREGPEPAWQPHGDWLVGIAKAPESGKELLVAVAAKSVEAAKVEPRGKPPESRTGLYVTSVLLVCLIMVSGAYLLWRDVQRDVALAGMRSQFVSSVSHELKTPLTAIRMFAEALRMRPGGDAAMRDNYLDTIVQESERLSRLVDNVLDFSKIEQGRKLYRMQPTPMGDLIDSVVRAIDYPLRQAGFELNVASGSGLPVLHADSDALQQAVMNLLTNAMKYSPERKRIDLAVTLEEGVIVIAVRDYGVGIPAEHRRKIFERFYRVPSVENQRVPGAGLGLTLVAHIAKAHGGDVVVESEPGAGSQFSLRLPVEQRI